MTDEAPEVAALLELTEAFMGGLHSFQAGLLAAMESTLAKMKAEAERPVPIC